MSVTSPGVPQVNGVVCYARVQEELRLKLRPFFCRLSLGVANVFSPTSRIGQLRYP
jgi:hypothetical protein